MAGIQGVVGVVRGGGAVIAIITVMAALFAGGCGGSPPYSADDPAFIVALDNGAQAREGFRRCHEYCLAWLSKADPETGLIPQNLTSGSDVWNAHNSAADNYPFMVLTASFTDRDLFETRMVEMLEQEIELTSRIGALPDDYSFSKRGFLRDEPDIGRIMFGASEYIKDGLLPLTEWLGRTRWSDRMVAILDDMWANAPVGTEFGDIVSESNEVNGEMLQTLSRLYWMYGDPRYLEWAVRLGDYYLLGTHHPTRDQDVLRLRDHGCEVVSGLCELYATVASASPEKREVYREPLHLMLDRILEVGRNGDGLFYNQINPRTGEILNDGVADTFGYTFNGYYTVYLLDGTEEYRAAVLNGLGSLDTGYRSFDWERGSADGYADAIESALNLYNREPIAGVDGWVDSETRVMWGKQREDGIIEGWHGDGNFARTTIMYCLWKTQGTSVRPWRDDIVHGAVRDGNVVKVAITASSDWRGVLVFDKPRHDTVMHLPMDWPRINQFPEWYTVADGRTYTVHDLTNGTRTVETGESLQAGIDIALSAGDTINLVVEPADTGD